MSKALAEYVRNHNLFGNIAFELIQTGEEDYKESREGYQRQNRTMPCRIEENLIQENMVEYTFSHSPDERIAFGLHLSDNGIRWIVYHSTQHKENGRFILDKDESLNDKILGQFLSRLENVRTPEDFSSLIKDTLNDLKNYYPSSFSTTQTVSLPTSQPASP